MLNTPMTSELIDYRFSLSFTFLSAGHSSESKNVAIWDTLLPQKKAMVACEFRLVIFAECKRDFMTSFLVFSQLLLVTIRVLPA